VVGLYGCNEREQLFKLLDSTRSGDILVLDRGFPSYEVIETLFARGVDFVIRVPAQKSFPAIDEFVRSNRRDGRVVLVRERTKHDDPRGPFELRAVRRAGADGRPVVLLTSLSRAEFSTAKIIDLYRRRWEIELAFRLEKGDYIGHGQFHSRVPDGVKQEVFSMLLFFTLSRHFMAAAARVHQVPYAEISQ